MRKITIKVDPELCIGAASCVTITPEIFQLNDENKAIVFDNTGTEKGGVYERVLEVDDDQFESIRLSAESCPTRAIFLYDEEGAQIYP